MARWLTPLRAVILALLAGVLLGVALSSPERTRMADSGTLQETRERFVAERLATAAVDEWRTAVIVDSLRSLHAQSADSPWTVSVAAGVPEWIAEGVRSAAERAQGRITSRAGAPHVAIAVVMDTLSRLGEWELDGRRSRLATVDHAISSIATDPCLIIIHVRRTAMGDDVRRAWYLSGIASEIPGTCGIVTAFGAPGPGIRDWLRRTNGDFARTADWQLPAPHVVQQESFSIRDVWWPSADEYAPREIGCLGGRAAACASWLDTTARAPGQLVPAGNANGESLVVGRVAGFFPHYKSSFVSDLIRARGSEAFVAMWTSDRSFHDAFQATYGESAGNWAAGWHRYIGYPVPVEVRSPWKGAPLSLLVAMMFVGGAMGYATRRRAGG